MSLLPYDEDFETIEPVRFNASIRIEVLSRERSAEDVKQAAEDAEGKVKLSELIRVKLYYNDQIVAIRGC